MPRLQNAALRFRITALPLRGCRLSGGQEGAPIAGTGPGSIPHCTSHQLLSLHSPGQAERRQAATGPLLLGLSFPSFPPGQTGVRSFSLFALAFPFSNEHSLECETIESHLPLTQIGKLRLRKRKGRAQRCTRQWQSLWKKGGFRPHYGCQGVGWGGVGPEWFSSLSGVTSQDNAPTALLGPPHTGILPS